MIISRRWKYAFVGLPFSASSGISKELVNFYDGEPISWKHSNVTDLIERGFDLSDYVVFAVNRDPQDIAFSHYNKMLTNAYGVFTQPDYFRENGGWVSRRARKVFNAVTCNDLDFSGYLDIQYRVPYDSVFSLNRPYLNYILDFEDLAGSFENLLMQIGIDPIRKIPIFNDTKKTSLMTPLDGDKRMKIFGPYLHYNGLARQNGALLNLRQNSIYKSIQPIRFARWKRIDRNMRKREINDYDYLND